jgi:hypothetical protein
MARVDQKGNAVALNTNTIALISVVIGFVGMAWAVFWPARSRPGSRPISSHWDIVYVDDEGIMHFTLVRVLKVNPGTRRMTAWCSTTGSERVFKLGKIVKAIDVRSGARIDVMRVLELSASSLASSSSSLVPARPGVRQERDTQAADSSGWWSASRLGMH